MYWPALTEDEIGERIKNALSENSLYDHGLLMGVPASYLDRKIFPISDKLVGAPFLQTLVANPNHIGVHTCGESEKYFIGTQRIEKELINLCGNEILSSSSDIDGYVSPGGTESNLQALWVYRNYFMTIKNAKKEEICVLHSEDTHYSVYKGCNVLSIANKSFKVNDQRQISKKDLKDEIENLQKKGIKYFIFIINMGTTMFGSVDKLEVFEESVLGLGENCKVHVDAAFGGLIYPFTNEKNPMNFKCPWITSFTLDGHKMLQAPYGTGLFLIRKNYIQHTMTKEAEYVHGKDYTLCGSRSGANAICMWMIFMSYGSEGGKEFCFDLVQRTKQICKELEKRNISFFSEPYMNIITIKANDISVEISNKYGLVSDRYDNPQWKKIVVMEHVDDSMIEKFITDLDQKYK